MTRVACLGWLLAACSDDAEADSAPKLDGGTLDSADVLFAACSEAGDGGPDNRCALYAAKLEQERAIGLAQLTTPQAISKGWGDARLSPDGRRVLFTIDGPGSRDSLRVVRLDTGQVRIVEEQKTLPWSRVFGESTWSPDGTRLAYLNAQATISLAAAGSASKPRIVREGRGDQLIRGLSWIAGPWLGYSLEDRRNGAAEQRLLNVDSGEELAAPAQWREDLSRALFVQKDADDRLTISIADLDGANARTLASVAAPQCADYPAMCARFSPDGAYVAYLDGSSLHVVRAHGGDDRVLADETLELSWSPSSRWLLATLTQTVDRASRYLVVATDGGASFALTQPDVTEAFVALWAHGDHGLLLNTGDRLVLIDPETQARRELSTPPIELGKARRYVLPPEGESIALYQSPFSDEEFRDSDSEAFLVPLDGSDDLELPGSKYSGGMWAADGSAFVYVTEDTASLRAVTPAGDTTILAKRNVSFFTLRPSAAVPTSHRE